MGTFKHTIIVCYLSQSLGDLFGAQALLHRKKPLNRVSIWAFALRSSIPGCPDNMGTNNIPPEVTIAADNTLANRLQQGIMSINRTGLLLRNAKKTAKYDRLWGNLIQWNTQWINTVRYNINMISFETSEETSYFYSIFVISLILSNIVHV